MKSFNFLGKTIGHKLSIKVYKLERCFDSLTLMNKVPVIFWCRKQCLVKMGLLNLKGLGVYFCDGDTTVNVLWEF